MPLVEREVLWSRRNQPGPRPNRDRTASRRSPDPDVIEEIKGTQQESRWNDQRLFLNASFLEQQRLFSAKRLSIMFFNIRLLCNYFEPFSEKKSNFASWNEKSHWTSDEGSGSHSGCHQQSVEQQQLEASLLLPCYYNVGWVCTGLGQRLPVCPVQHRGQTQ